MGRDRRVLLCGGGGIETHPRLLVSGTDVCGEQRKSRPHAGVGEHRVGEHPLIFRDQVVRDPDLTDRIEREFHHRHLAGSLQRSTGDLRPHVGVGDEGLDDVAAGGSESFPWRQIRRNLLQGQLHEPITDCPEQCVAVGEMPPHGRSVDSEFVPDHPA